MLKCPICSQRRRNIGGGAAYRSWVKIFAQRKRNLGFQLSVGEQQMLAIGRAPMPNPDLLILDEATEGLAPLIREEIWTMLGRLKEDGLSTLLIDKKP